jgi:indole-3-glycerol phosphate synthase
MSVLEQIVERTRERLRAEEKPDRRRAEEVAEGREPFAFRNALPGPPLRVIAEIKAASPSAGPIVPDPDVEAIARDYARGGAAAMSVVTEPEFFGGSREWIARARQAAGLPVLMKDFVVDAGQIVRGIAAGADAVLLLASLLETAKLRDFIALLEAYGCDALVEVHDEAELSSAVAAGARIIGVNNRDLRDFRVDLATSERIGALIPDGVLRVAESGIRSAADVARLAAFDAVLVGESLLRQPDRAAAVRELLR